MKITNRQSAVGLDVCAISLSTLCLIHCLAIPLLVVFLPASMLWLENEWLHRGLVLLALPVSGTAIAASLAGREPVIFSIAVAIGLSMLLAAAFLETLHDVETLVTVIGAIVLAIAHGYRWAHVHRHA